MLLVVWWLPSRSLYRRSTVALYQARTSPVAVLVFSLRQIVPTIGSEKLSFRLAWVCLAFCWSFSWWVIR